jgi:hypothetical protein
MSSSSWQKIWYIGTDTHKHRLTYKGVIYIQSRAHRRMAERSRQFLNQFKFCCLSKPIDERAKGVTTDVSSESEEDGVQNAVGKT